jgi:SAM-dependent methyltransferase
VTVCAESGSEAPLLKTKLLRREELGGHNTWTDRPANDTLEAGVFEGVYGRSYDRVVRSKRLRRIVFGAWGSAEPLVDLEGFVADLVEAHQDGVVADVPCGAGVLLRLLAMTPFEGTVVEVDLARQMMERAVAVQRELAPKFETVFLRSDALALPLTNGAVDAAFSLNGLHVIARPRRFLSELARITRPKGMVWLISPIDNRASARSRAILAAARRIAVTPRPPPTAGELSELASAAGLQEVRSYGGESITGRVFRRVD